MNKGGLGAINLLAWDIGFYIIFGLTMWHVAVPRFLRQGRQCYGCGAVV